MTTRPMRSIADRLGSAELALNNALKDEGILEAVSLFGYDSTRLQEGLNLYQEALDLVNRQAAEYGDQFEATRQVEEARQTASAVYMPALKVARVALRDYERAGNALRMNGERKKSLMGWLEQAQGFYANLLADETLLAAMGNFGYDRAKLEAQQALVQAVYDEDNSQEGHKGAAQQATMTRDAKMDELAQWVADFKVIAQVALEENPQWLEKLGFGTVA